jgi:molybdopterin/thiamine biosynthesis adenylyltransferase
VTPEPWWRANPERLQREEQALRDAGIAFTRNDDAARAGVIQMTVTVVGRDGRPVEMSAVYPDTYPYFKPTVFVEPMGLNHHHNPVTGELCLLKSGNGAWRPSDTLAALLTEQWPKLLAANSAAGRDTDGALLETVQPEPVTVYLTYELNQVIVLDGDLILPAGADRGTMAVAIPRTEPLTGYVRSAGVDNGPDFFTGGPLYVGNCPVLAARWVLLPEMPANFDAQSLWASAAAVDPAAKDHWATLAANSRPGQGLARPQIQLLLIGIPEEVAHRQLGVGWIALTRYRSSNRKPPGLTRLVRVQRGGPSDLHARAPELSALATRGVTVIGGGGLGSAIITELARTGLARLIIVDGDVVDIATAVRFPAAVRFAGQRKVHALVQLARENHPYTEVVALDGRIGISGGSHEADQAEFLSENIANSDLVIDATADTSVQHYVSDLARDLGTGYLQAEATRGVWAGLLALYTPGADLCWMCVQHYLTDGTIEPLPASSAPDVQPPGCAEPTYPGTGFDLATIASHALRLAVAHLTGPDGYGTIPGNVHTVQLRDPIGQPVPPLWTQRELTRHPSCENHP